MEQIFFLKKFSVSLVRSLFYLYIVYPACLSLKMRKKDFIYTKNFDFKEKKSHNSDPVDSYFECISSCDIKDGTCISRYVEILKENDN